MIPTFPKAYWKSSTNKRKFLDEFKLKFKIIQPKEWGNITTQNIVKSGGISLLNQYGGSLYQCLRSVYSGFTFFLQHLIN